MPDHLIGVKLYIIALKINQILTRLEQQELANKLFRYEIQKWAKTINEAIKNISEIKQTLL